MSSQADRIARIETRQGHGLPGEYSSFLRAHSEASQARNSVVASNPDKWGVRYIFELGAGPAFLQLDEVLRTVGDVIPAGTIPIAEDEAGNLFLLDCVPGETHGAVLWWDHERELHDDRIDVVAPSFQGFIEQLRPEEG